MAYVLGFWFADGYMRHEKSYRVLFSSNDVDIILKIRQSLGSGHPLYRGKNRNDYELAVFSKKLYLKLLSLGGKRCKNKTMDFPKIPSKYLPDFIRGFFDGDGSVFYVTYIHTKTKKPRTELRSNFTAGNSKFLESLQNIFIRMLSFKHKKVCPFNNGASWKLGYGTYDTIKLLKFMYYPNHSISLERKAVFVEKI